MNGPLRCQQIKISVNNDKGIVSHHKTHNCEIAASLTEVKNGYALMTILNSTTEALTLNLYELLINETLENTY